MFFSENYMNAIDVDYDSEDVFTGWLYKLKTHEFSKVNRSRYGRSTVFKQHLVEYTGNNFYNSTIGNYFIKCFNYLTG